MPCCVKGGNPDAPELIISEELLVAGQPPEPQTPAAELLDKYTSELVTPGRLLWSQVRELLYTIRHGHQPWRTHLEQSCRQLLHRVTDVEPCELSEQEAKESLVDCFLCLAVCLSLASAGRAIAPLLAPVLSIFIQPALSLLLIIVLPLAADLFIQRSSGVWLGEDRRRALMVLCTVLGVCSGHGTGTHTPPCHIGSSALPPLFCALWFSVTGPSGAEQRVRSLCVLSVCSVIVTGLAAYIVPNSNVALDLLLLTVHGAALQLFLAEPSTNIYTHCLLTTTILLMVQTVTHTLLAH